MALLWIAPPSSAQEEQTDAESQAYIPVKIGVLASLSPDKCLTRWAPTAYYLTEQIPHCTFTIIPLTFKDVTAAVDWGKVDFILTNPALYVELEHRFSIARIATLRRYYAGKERATSAAIILFRISDQDQFKQISDLQGHSFAAVDEMSFGGWLMALREMKNRGFNPRESLRELQFYGSHEAVARAVGDGLADAGTVRADAFERMTANGTVDGNAFGFLELRHDVDELIDLPTRHATRPYPEWPIAKLRHTPDDVAQEVAIALLSMPSDGVPARAAQCAGWTLPLDYGSVEECLRELNVGVYAEIARESQRRFVERYLPYLWAALAVLMILVLMMIYVHHLNLRLKGALSSQKRELDTRRLTEEALREAYEGHENLEQIIDYSPAICFLLRNERDWPVEFVSHNVHNFGYSPADFQSGKVHFANIIYPDDRARAAAELVQYDKDEQDEFVQEYRIRTKSGVTKWVENHMRARRATDERITHYQGLLLDITKRKKAEESLRQNKSHTEQINRELAAAIQKSEQMALEARRANSAKSEFLERMTHQIRRPIEKIAGQARLLQDAHLDSPHQALAADIESAADNLTMTVSDILDFSGIERGTLQLLDTEFDLPELLNKVAESRTSRVAAKDLTLSLQLDPELPRAVHGDPVRLRQVLCNLIDNAIAFTLDGGITVKATVDHDYSDRAVMRFLVEDTGIGIPRDRLGTLFQAFTQGDSTISRRHTGTGLGLAICKRLVGMMDGHIGVTSRKGHGSSFWFSVSLRKRLPHSQGPSATATDLCGKRILVVDDNENDRHDVAVLLRDLACEWREAATAHAALRELRQAAEKGQPFDVVLIDLVMPDTDGETLAKTITADTSLPPSAMLLMTSCSNPELSHLQSAGFAAFLTKPPQRRQLEDCLHIALSDSPPGD